MRLQLWLIVPAILLLILAPPVMGKDSDPPRAEAASAGLVSVSTQAAQGGTSQSQSLFLTELKKITSLRDRTPNEADWAVLVISMPEQGAFAEIRDYVLNAERPGSVVEFDNLSSAIRILAQRSQAFRRDLANFAREEAFLKTNHVRYLVLTALLLSCRGAEGTSNVEICASDSTGDMHHSANLAVFRALLRNRGYHDGTRASSTASMSAVDGRVNPGALSLNKQSSSQDSNAVGTMTGFRSNFGVEGVGATILQWLQVHLALYKSKPVGQILLVCHIVLAESESFEVLLNRESSQAIRADRESLKHEDRALRRAALEALLRPELVEQSDWNTTIRMYSGSDDIRTAMSVCQDALLAAYSDLEFGDRKDEVTRGLERHLDRCVMLWSAEYAAWNWIELDGTGSVFSVQDAWRAEQNLRLALRKLEAAKFLTPQTASRYQKWITLAGGWDEPAPDAPAQRATTPPLPSWMRDYKKAEDAARELDLAQAVPLSAYIRQARRQYDTEGVAPADAVPLNNVSDPSLRHTLSHLAQSAPELVALAGASNALALKAGTLGQALDPGGSTPLPTQPKRVSEAPFRLPREAAVRSTTADFSLHHDYIWAMRSTLGTYYAWRADTEYRILGPRLFGEVLKAEGAREFYIAALQTMPVETEKRAPIGLGLFGRVLQLESEQVARDCAIRVKQIDLGMDYLGDAAGWPSEYAWHKLKGVKTLLEHLGRVSDSTVDILFRNPDLAREITIRKARVKERTKEFEAQNLQVSYEENNLLRRNLEIEQQKLRQDMAKVRTREAEFLLKAAEWVVMSKESEDRAQEARRQKAKYIVGHVREQVKSLQEKIPVLENQLQDSVTKINVAAEEVSHTFEAAKKEGEAVQIINTLMGPLTKVVSLVSTANTGMDLGGLVEPAITGHYDIFRALKNKDYKGAALSYVGMQIGLVGAVDKASGGKVMEQVDKELGPAKKFLGDVQDTTTVLNSLIPTDFKKVVEQIRAEMPGASAPDVEKVAAELAGALALRSGLSFLKRKTELELLVNRIGGRAIDNAQLENLQRKVQERALEAAYAAIQKQGERVIEEAAKILDCRPDKKSICEKLTSEGKAIETEVVNVLVQVQKSVPEADLAAYKVTLAGERDRLVQELATQFGAATSDVEQEIARLAGSAFHVSQPPPSTLPKVVHEKINAIQEKVKSADEKLKYLGSSKLREDFLKQAGDLKAGRAENMKVAQERVMGELNAAIADIRACGPILKELREELARLNVENTVKEHDAQYEDWMKKAKEADVSEAKDRVQAAQQNILALNKQEEVEKKAIEIAQNVHAGQRILVEQAKARRDSVQSALDAVKEEEMRADADRQRWLFYNSALSDQQRNQLLAARLFYRDFINKEIAQVWRMIGAFEPHVLANTFSTRPSFGLPNYNELNDFYNALDGAKQVTRAQAQDQYRILTTLKITQDVVSSVMGPSVIGQSDEFERRVLLAYDGNEANMKPLKLGPEGLVALQTGLTFTILPEGAEPAPPVSPLAPQRTLYVNAPTTYALRILAVRLDIIGGYTGNPPIFTLTQEQGWTAIPIANSKSGVRVFPLTPVTLELSGLNTRSISTRPLYGTYTLRLSPEQMRLLNDPAGFIAELHFIAVGVPKSAFGN